MLAKKKEKKNTKISKRHKPTCKERAREGVLLDDGQEREGRRKRQKGDAAVGWRFVLQPVMQDRGHCMVLGIFGRKEWSMLYLLRYVLLVVHLWVLAIWTMAGIETKKRVFNSKSRQFITR